MEKNTATPIFSDTSPICLACGQVMEWNGEYRCFAIDLIDIDEEIYECRNPDCDDDDGFEDWLPHTVDDQIVKSR